ncbi:DUF1326 domain-containing protein [Leisingera sp. ANG59]|uniref:DUF1326 domain-containing protein n=1 Tax=Leisingera sp. ANG59 TaxID=2675221 RepID=UPI001573E5E5|nr:DUF1326 domain-containing protein [Leisingera sp. ANG59]NSY38958.1 DUF1326 domain-containing protein [Leisingera sp. ANG59]
MANVDWYIEGPSFGNCNCNYGCPCQFEDLPTHGHCTGFEVFQIDKGHFGETDLAGARAALLYAWPGPVFEGKGAMQAIIDDRATEAQRAALETVLTGGETDEEATHWWVYHAMCDTVHETLTKRIDYEVDIENRTAKLDIEGLVTSSGRPIQAPHGGGEHRVRIDIPGGIEFTLAEIGSASTRSDAAIKLDLNDSYGQWAIIRHGPHGVAA